jgi:hypothetical protein
MDEERMKEMVPRRMTTAQPQGLGVVRHVAFQQKGD